MQLYRFRLALTTALAAVLFFSVAASGQPPRAPFPLEPEGTRGEAIFPALEGWYPNADGSFTILLGYFSRNEEPVHIPIGPDNQIQPGGPDLGQPTHFLAAARLGRVLHHRPGRLRRPAISPGR